MALFTRLNVYSVWHNCMFILLLLYCWLLVSASKGHHQANIYEKLEMLVHVVQYNDDHNNNNNKHIFVSDGVHI